jgi:hypothetical protein
MGLLHAMVCFPSEPSGRIAGLLLEQVNDASKRHIAPY